MILETPRLLGATGLLLAYAGIVWQAWRRHQARRHKPATACDWLIVHASQTGTAEGLAQQTAASLRTAGLSVAVLGIDQLAPADLAAQRQVLWLVSTYGEGDPPDCAAPFAARQMHEPAKLGHMRYGVLALGDRSYKAFRQFGLQLDEWLQQSGAQPLFERVDVDRGDSAAIGQWQQQLSRLAGIADGAWTEAPPSHWRLDAREYLNPASPGAPVYALHFKAVDPMPSWEAGDLVQVNVPADPTHPREYSIASIPTEDELRLLVRLHQRPDGGHGLASGFLTQELALGSVLPLRLRPHPRFRLDRNAERPLILIGNGTGLAGLRGLLAARATAGRGENWLLFGERSATADRYFDADLQRWLAEGKLARLDRSYSREPGGPRYVQDCLVQQAERLRDWVARGAAIYVCGSLHGMAADVDATLVQILGQASRDALQAEGRYRRDVY
ncbi:sulfite reductase subunit alpha [Massilia sp. TS11]|uniref:sulfite reductase subunit alpha n=1 Tax=Massilia sp. TS11 TaxID=2908003 RepID=UPI001EDC785A|nr:sulfite reductase subunit alpha [Massilia sp. TS11]MCG2584716.1 sulfite reductase subunit alpha [Massilia sp. TS11]